MTLTPILFVFANFIYITQEPPPPPMPPPPPGLPIDGAVIFILALGLMYGINKKMRSLNSNMNY